MRRIWLLLLLFPLCSQSSSVPMIGGDVVILFDQSQSMGRYNAKLVAEQLLLTLINTFGVNNPIIFAGFAEKVEVHLRIERYDTPQTAIDREQLRQQIKAIPLRGKVTDFEPALRYLERYDEQQGALALAVIITDGQPDIWDRKLRYLNPEIRHDPRYAQLNQRQEKMVEAGATADARYDALNHGYEEKNNEIIEQTLTQLASKTGERLILLNLGSGAENFMRQWHERAAATLIETPLPVAADANQAATDTLLRQTLQQLLEISSRLFAVPLPGDAGQRIDLASDSDLFWTPPQRDSEKEQVVTPQPPTPPAMFVPPPPWYTIPLLQQQLLLSWVLLLYLILRIRQRRDFARRALTFPPLDDPLYVDAVQRRLFAISTTSPESANRYLDEQIREASSSGNKTRLRLLELEKLKYRFDRRISLRAKIPPDTMALICTPEVTSPLTIIDISLQALHFHCAEFNNAKISGIQLLSSGETFAIATYHLRKRSEIDYILLLERFVNETEHRMRWIELLTRVESQTFPTKEVPPQ
ncbi:MAG: VWA domain-containing protein [Gammaproteobacteria bacterium]|nr:VWA domain-containing protein [Gammaproteobacteria bacterium]